MNGESDSQKNRRLHDGHGYGRGYDHGRSRSHSRSRSRWALWATLALALSPIAVIFQNCGRFHSLPSTSELDSASMRSSVDDGAYDSNCLANPAYDACIFMKSPLWQKGGSVSVADLNAAPLSNFQTFGIVLPTRARSAVRLDTSSIHIVSVLKPGFDGGWKVVWSNENHSIIAHLMAYHWSQAVMEYFRAAGASSYIEDNGLTIDTEAAVTGFSSTNKTIYLQAGAGVSAHALDASVLVHLMGEAALDFASQGKIYDLAQDTRHVDCGSPGEPVYAGDCCASEIGCSKALSAGLSDYLVSVIFEKFENATAVGDGVSMDPAGVPICGSMNRNPSLLARVRASEAYNACAGEGRAGQVFAMGSFYSSIWWSVRRVVTQMNPNHLGDLDRLYVQLLARLDGADDFRTALGKLIQLDQQIFQSKFSALFQEEYLRRGL